MTAATPLAANDGTAKTLIGALGKVDQKLVKGEAHQAWISGQGALKKAAGALQQAGTIEDARSQFHLLSNTLIALAKTFQLQGRQPILLFHCPMAFDSKGADWLQNKPGTENPYYGSMMFRCGEQTEVIAPGSHPDHQE